ncbi:MAG: nitrate reductase molybdenum cofactor assembly chaperone [Alphaproteobacteria bacterium]
MTQTFKALSALLCYPDGTLQAAVGELMAVAESERILPPAKLGALAELTAEISRSDLLDLQSRYVDLFDRTRALSLHLFEHVHGESRERGQAMVSLLERYTACGFEIATKELPDYIPLFLEFLSTQPAAVGREFLSEPVHILAALSERLKKRSSAYSAVFDALIAIAQAQPDEAALAELRETGIEDPHDLAAVDKAWEEAEVRFGPGDASSDGCPRVSDLLNKMGAPIAQDARTANEEVLS